MPTPKEEQLIKLLLLCIGEMQIMLNKMEPGKFRNDAQQRIENLVAAIWSEQE